jgi:ubiquinone/menaquinone biosynthesis C-methylase UbiE
MALSVDQKLADNYADYYDQDKSLTEWRRLGALDKCQNIVLLCSRLEHDKILEIGCGEGALLGRLTALKLGSKFAGLEISSSAVRCVQQKKLPNVEVQLFDGYQIPYEDRCFDLAILSHVIEHVEYPRKLIYEAARVARKVFVEVPLEDNRKLSNDFMFDHVGHINFYNVKTIRSLVQSCGMKILDAHLSHSSLSSYVYRLGAWRGNLSYVIKELGLRLWPKAAARCFVYHYSLIYAKPQS